jgi:hypothetical protein
MKNGSGKGAANGSAATTFPDILNGGGNGKLSKKIINYFSFYCFYIIEDGCLLNLHGLCKIVVKTWIYFMNPWI